MKDQFLDYLKVRIHTMKNNRTRTFFLFSAIIMSFVCLIASVLHYTRISYGNHLTWIGWLSSIVLYLLTFAHRNNFNFNRFLDFRKLDKNKAFIFFFLIILFFVSHLWNFKTAPWNHNGLFDDASWNIFEAKKYIFSAEPFQGAFWRDGSSSAKGVIFHYYIMVLFNIFGFNTLVFNLGVMLLAFFSYFFTFKLIDKLFANNFITVISALTLNFLPLHFVFSFVGQRYAVAPPLMMASIYFLYTGFKNKSFLRIALSSVFAGFCFSGAIMGKQYLMGLAVAIPLFLIFNFKNSIKSININLTKSFIIGLILSAMPMIMYMAFNPVYFTLEKEYSQAFLNTFFSQGFSGLSENIERAQRTFFDSSLYYIRWFIPDHVLIPFVYYIFIIPGIISAFLHKRFEYLTICLVSFAGAFVAGFSDYRVLMVSPLFAVFLAFGLKSSLDVVHYLIINKTDSKKYYVYTTYAIITAVLCTNLLPCALYLHEKSKNPYSVYFFAQRDVAVSRYLRDIVMGVSDPKPVFKWQEFKKPHNYTEPDYDTLICIEYGYAVPHTFLYDFNAEKILSFGDMLPFNLFPEKDLFFSNKNSVMNYYKTDKDLKLIWEKTPKSDGIINKFKSLNYLGRDELISSSHEGSPFTFYVLTIENENIDKFKEEVSKINY